MEMNIRAIQRLKTTLIILITVVGCAHKDIKIVDPKGKPIEGALVISSQTAFIFQPWHLSVYQTDKKGNAKAFYFGAGYIFKPGYFPIIESSDLANELTNSPPSSFASTTTLYPIKTEKNIQVDISRYFTEPTIDQGLYAIPLDVCPSVQVSYDAKKRRIKAVSLGMDLITSDRFYFVGPSKLKKVSEIEHTYNIAYYCEDKGRLYKIGVSDPGVSFEHPSSKLPYNFTIFKAAVPSLDAYLQPEVKCMTDRHSELFPFKRSKTLKHKISTSKGIKEHVRAIKNSIPCSNKYSDEVFTYLEAILP